MRTKPTPYPEFLAASEYEDDPYWKQALINASHGEFSSRLTEYKNGRLSRKDSTEPSVRIPKNNPESVASTFVRFHKKHDKTLSDQELQNQVSRRYEVCSRHVVLTWPTASLQMKRAALNHYAVTVCSNMLFDTERQRSRSVRDLSATLFTAMGMKLLDKNSIRMDNNVITDVRCVKYDNRYSCWILIALT